MQPINKRNEIKDRSLDDGIISDIKIKSTSFYFIIDPQYTTYNPIDDSGRTFSEDGGSDAYAFDSIIGTSKIQPHTRRTGTVVMISNHHFTVKNLKFEVGEIWANDDDQLSDGGVASLD